MSNNALGLRVLSNVSAQLKDVDRKFAAGIRKNIREAVRLSGSDVLDQVRRNAGWSSRIPAATDLQVRFNPKGASVRIQVDKRKAPHARPLELGNRTTFSAAAIAAHGGYKTINGRQVAVKRSAYQAIRSSGIGIGRALRHPVFDSGKPPTRVGQQPTRPFFFTGVAQTKDRIDMRMEVAVIRSAREAGFR